MSGDQRRKMCVNCDRRSFGLGYEPRQDFVLSQWSDLPLPYAVWRSVVALYTVSVAVYSGLDGGHGYKIVIWLTYWSYYILSAGFVVGAVNCWVFWLYSRRRRKRDCLKSECFLVSLKTHWVLYNLAVSSALLITILFWAVVYDGGKVSFITMNVHGINVLLVVIDLAVTRCPIRIQHFYISAIYCATYAIFTVVYWAAGGTNTWDEPFIYGVLNYDKSPGIASAFLVSVTLVVVPLIHSLAYAAYRLRLYTHEHCRRKVEPGTTPEMEKIAIGPIEV